MPDRRPRTAWLLSVAVLLALALVGVLLLPRVAGPERGVAVANPSARASSSAAASGPLQLLGFGDSVMIGAGCDCANFLTQTAEQLHARTGRTIHTVNNGANGETAAGVLQDLADQDGYRAQIAKADVIVVILGANDLVPTLNAWHDQGCDAECYLPQVRTMGQRLSAILTLLDRDKKPGAVVMVMSYWNVLEDGQVGRQDYGDAYLDWSDAVTKAANTTICRAAEQAKATCVDTYAPFKGDGSDDPTKLLADDGDHPNAAGTTLLADVLRAAILRSMG